MIVDLTPWTNLSLLLLRIIVVAVFISGGMNGIRKPAARGKSIEMPPSFTFALGVWEFCGGVSILVGLWTQVGAAMLVLAMLGAVGKEIFAWHKPFFEGTTGGWHYDVLLLCANLVILTTAGGAWVLIR